MQRDPTQAEAVGYIGLAAGSAYFLVHAAAWGWRVWSGQ